ncbi:MAG: DksA/TraR family C4-type zinc finger protein [Gammaproteobacteria bacterium]
MATGWAKDGAVQEQIDASIADAVQRARAQLAQAPGSGRTHCEDCEAEIPEARRVAVPGVRRCVQCQERADADARFRDPINRRGSKDSQLR